MDVRKHNNFKGTFFHSDGFSKIETQCYPGFNLRLSIYFHFVNPE